MAASKTKNIQSGGIMLAEDWKLFPIDDRNWELCQLRDGVWRKCEKFYSYNTVAHALLYVADVQLKRGCKDEAIDLRAVVDELQAMAERMEKVRGVRW